MKIRSNRPTRALTLTELLVVLVIISLLATIAVPVYINQIQRARVSIAQAETREIAEAMQACAATHGFLVPIHILDNVPDQASGSTSGGSQRDDFDAMSGDFGSTFLIDIYKTLTDQNTGSQATLNSSDPRVVAMINGWQGPFLNPKRIRYVGETVGDPTTGTYYRDLVVDPWGNPYRFYTDLGATGSFAVTGSTSVMQLTMDNGQLTSQEPNRFDRYAIVSWGPNGVTDYTAGNQLDQGDDLSYAFSVTSGNESNYRPF